jgi:hypothetical protein
MTVMLDLSSLRPLVTTFSDEVLAFWLMTHPDDWPPILVRASCALEQQPSRWQIVDGTHRASAAWRLHRTSIAAVVT